MPALTLRKIEGEILVIGPIYNQIDKISTINELKSNYQWIIINGDVCHPSGNIQEKMSQIDELCKDPKILYNLGKHDLIESNQNKESKWFQKPNVIIVDFINQTNLIITNGGLTPAMTRESLQDNIETTFVSHIDDKPWHETYFGAYGYVISNNPLSEGPNFYNYSMQMGNHYIADGPVYAQEVNQYGLKETILL